MESLCLGRRVGGSSVVQPSKQGANPAESGSGAVPVKCWSSHWWSLVVMNEQGEEALLSLLRWQLPSELSSLSATLL